MDSKARPLAGKRVVVTRAPEQAEELIAALGRLGAEVLLLSTVAFAPPEDFSNLDDAIARLLEDRKLAETATREEGADAPSFSKPRPPKNPSYEPTHETPEPELMEERGGQSQMERSGAQAPLRRDARSAKLKPRSDVAFEWILFTSQNAVRFFARRLRERLEPGRSSEFLARCRTAAVGPATAEAAMKEGFRVDYVAHNPTGEAMARELAGALRGRRVLLPRSDRADDRLPAALRQAGAEVSEVVAYRTSAPKVLDPELLESVRGAQVDAIVFASPSAFQNLCGWIPAGELAELSRRVGFAAIGPTTTRALREAGVRVGVEAADTSMAALAEAIVSYHEKHPAAARRA